MTPAGHQPRTAHLDLLRCAAAVAVVLVHASGLEWGLAVIGSAGWRNLTLLDAASRWCVPIFFMLTGALFLPRAAQPSWPSLVRRSLPRLVVAFLFWSLLYSLFALFLRGEALAADTIIQSLPVSYYHLWFLPVMIGIYLLLPLLWWVFQNRPLSRMLIVLWCLAMTLESIAHFDGSGVLQRLLDQALPPQLGGYAAFVLLGGLLATTSHRLDRRWLATAVAVSIGGITALTLWESLRIADHVTTWFEYLTPLVTLGAAALFLLARSAEPWLQQRPELCQRLRRCGELTFGIYLLHPMVLGLARQLPMTIPRGALRSILFWLVALAASAALTWLLRRSRPVARWLV
ncbi:acyltransferase [Luteococcus sp. OSA5]|uniref:acyltransferase n=1 Tax=Luteococcus sp. OSA5 TaxID=3401630 RepID=UPI003B433545